MDVSIAVTLIRGQMGAVVERAVNGAVETVLAEMLKVVGVKFEELKAELLLAKRGAAALQREKALKEKENDNIRARLRYTELKLKYYRQGVEEELQQRAAAAAFRSSPGRDAAHRKDLDQQDQFNWTDALLHRPDGPDTNRGSAQRPVNEATPPPAGSPSSDVCDQAGCSTLPPTAPQVKQEEEELEAEQEDEEELVSIKEEPEEEEEEQEVMASLLMDTQLPGSETLRSFSHWTKLTNQTSRPTSFSSANQNSYPQLTAPLTPSVAPPPGLPWTNELSLYEEYKLRRNELRRRSLNRRKELEKTLPQPLLADLVRERREKTRLRVARWRAKRKLQAQGGAVALAHSGFPVGEQQLHACGLSSASSAAPPTSLFMNSMNSSVASILHFLPPSSSSSTSCSSTSSLQASTVAPPEHSITSCFLQSSQSQHSTAHNQSQHSTAHNQSQHSTAHNQSQHSTAHSQFTE